MTNTILKTDFPRLGSPEAQLRFLLQYAVLAPSSHNTQPWLWEIEGEEVVLRADRRRGMAALDPEGRELIMSCGAALQHLTLAIRAFGYAALTQILPDSEQPDVLARVRLGAARTPTEEDELLFRFINKRHTHRGVFEERPLPSELLHDLQEDARREQVSLHFAYDTEDQKAIIELIEQGDLVQNRDAAVRRDLAAWIAPNSERNDGIPTCALGMSGIMSHLAPMSQRMFDRGKTLAEKDRKTAANAPVLAILCTAGEGTQAWLAAGQALGRVLLRARAANVWASFFSQPIQVDATWRQLRYMIGIHEFPQLVFRLGYAQAASAFSTPRRSVDEVTIEITPSDKTN